METTQSLQIHVKSTNNCAGMPLTSFAPLGPEWSGDEIVLPFGGGDEAELCTVVGWTDLFGGSATRVHVVLVEEPGGTTGFLVYGGNSGVRVLSETAPVDYMTMHLPRGFGMPIVWIEGVDDLPEDVRAVVG